MEEATVGVRDRADQGRRREESIVSDKDDKGGTAGRESGRTGKTRKNTEKRSYMREI